MSEIEVGSVWVNKNNGSNIKVVGINCAQVNFYDVCDKSETLGVMNKSQLLLNYELDDFYTDRKTKHSHYHKDVSQYDTIDVYAVCKIFDVQDTSGCLQHAIKKLLVTGKRGHKDRQTDIQNAIDTLNRLLELESE